MKINKEILYNCYIIKEMSMKEIATEYNIAVGTVFNYIKKYGIESRKNFTLKHRQKISNKKKGSVSPMKGKKHSLESREKIRKSRLGAFTNPTQFGGHKKIRKDGYISIYLPSHPFCNKDGYVMEHVLIMEKELGRFIKENEIVHHKNKIRNDNRIQNLQVMTFKEHASFHMKERHKKKKKKGMMTY